MRPQLWDRACCTITTKRFFLATLIFASYLFHWNIWIFYFHFEKARCILCHHVHVSFSSLGFICVCVSLLCSTRAQSDTVPHIFPCLLVIQSQYFCWHLWEDGAEEDLKGSVEDRPEQPGEDHRAASEQWQLGEHINQHNWVAIKSPAFTYSWDYSGDSKGDGKHTHTRTHLWKDNHLGQFVPICIDFSFKTFLVICLRQSCFLLGVKSNQI